MTRARTAGRGGGRRVQTPATLGPVPGAVASLVLAAMLALVAAACGTSVPTGSPSAAGSAAPSGDASSGGVPLPTPWPGNSVLGIEALGAADGQIGEATTDLSRAIADEDLALLREAAAGLAGLDVLLPNMEKLRLNPAMRPFADSYEAAIIAIDDGATRLRDAIDDGDADSVGTSTQDLLDGLKLYAGIQGELAAWIEQMPEQKRLLLR